MKQHILTEGNDIHVILQVCIKQGLNRPKGFQNKNDFEENFRVKNRSGETLGKEELLILIPDAVRTPDLQALGIVLDADQDALFAWKSVCSKLEKSGYLNLPAAPDANGTIIIDTNPYLPKVGIWIVPDNQSKGEIEDFFLQLIDRENFHLQHAHQIIGDLIEQKQNLFDVSNRSKAETHTWLAWQAEPGKSMGLSIKSNWASGEHPLAARLATWFAKLFELED